MTSPSTATPIAVVDFSSLPLKDLNFMVRQIVIRQSLLVRNLLALKRTGFKEIAIQYRIEQDTLRRDLARHPILGKMLSWHPSTKTKPTSAELLKQVSRDGCYWIHPLFFANRRLLPAFEKARLAAPQTPLASTACGRHFLWLPAEFLQTFEQSAFSDPAAMLRAQTAHEFSLDDAQAGGILVQNYLDAEDMERALLRDAASRRKGFLRRTFHQPLTLWLTRQFARMRVHPHLITGFRCALGILAALLVIRGSSQDSYAAMSWGAALFYLLEILDEVDGELARLNLRESARGARLDRAVDRLTWVLFLLAVVVAAYQKLQILYRLFALIFIGTTFLMIGAAFGYAAFVAWRHFGRASYSVYRELFLAKLPLDQLWTKIFFFLRNLASRDLAAAFIAVCVCFYQPEVVIYAALLGAMALLASFIYFGREYGSLLPTKPASADETSPAEPTATKAAG